jgi:hypothetical protein
MLSFENIFQRRSPVRVQIEPSSEDYSNSKTVLRTVMNAHLSMLESGEIVPVLDTPPKVERPEPPRQRGLRRALDFK